VLDEPTASLDPLARHEFMSSVLTAMADDGVTVILSSHLLSELERVADYLVLISRGEVRLDDPVEAILARHRLVTQPADDPADPGWDVIETTTAGAQTHRLVRFPAGAWPGPGGSISRPVGIEELAMSYLRDGVPTTHPLTGAAR
jgi:ABC-2 type transport system ATP-binding protein